MTESSPKAAPAPEGSGWKSPRHWLRSLWLEGRDRAVVFTDAADMATKAAMPYWLVLVIAGAIASLGLALNSAAVVIGAMLIAPLLPPIIGLSLALAIGDARLAIVTGLIVLGSTLAVVATGALLTFALPLPFQAITSEISSRTHPTTLDLAIAIFSGLAGAVVTVARRSRLAGAVPGVAVSVALVPPLAVTGYGIGIGFNWSIVRGSLLLYGANLAGIVMSAMVVFLLAGMHQEEVLDVDRTWHTDAPHSVFGRWVERVPGLRSLGIMGSTWTRIGLVVAFVALVAIPLRASLKEIARESRVYRAVDEAAKAFSTPGQSFIISRDVQLDQARTRVVLNVATTGWFSDSARRAFEHQASTTAEEPVTLALEQLPASSGNLAQLASLVATPDAPAAPMAAVAPRTPEQLVLALRAQVSEAVHEIALPDSIAVLRSDLSLGDSIAGATLRMEYLSADTLSSQARQMLERQLGRALSLTPLRLDPVFVPTIRMLGEPPGSAVDAAGVLLRRYPQLRIEVIAGSSAPRGQPDSIVARLTRAGVAAGAITMLKADGRALLLRVPLP